ncbi:MAG: hypothetical protein WCO84_07855, partial [bacterium]
FLLFIVSTTCVLGCFFAVSTLVNLPFPAFLPILMHILAETGHQFLSNADTDSCSKRTVFPVENGHGFLMKTDSGGIVKTDSDSC